MIKILFVCHGNICRSPMSEFVMKHLVSEAGLNDFFEIASAATTSEEIGNPIYPPAQKTLAAHGIPFERRAAWKVRKADYEKYDMLILMDEENEWGIRRAIGEDRDRKISFLMDYTERPGDVADPWYTRDFETTYRDVDEGCRGLLRYVLKWKKELVYGA